ncbi:MAG TPA: chromosome segregation protein SMC [Tepidisphaeraceae bacterium]|nr:chromosome segregation protein SMC [Tepidisphaeraceae bacterium]
MRLNKLILHGFKSFADRTEFVFDSPITGIVGPNGCGKSNVVDAFKWVLGEQSAKSLRGDAMLDVIFNGSGGRKPAGMAEVVLVFDNPVRADGTRTLNLETDEVAVGRRLYRDGTSEYQVNNQSSRLKDIRELFLDTGVGVDAYSVIEQGRVAALLEANPEERRLIFEEAAGISKFKQRKKEAQRKLEKVDQNLVRVNDIVEEVEKRLRSVKIQAGRARTYQEYSVRLSELRLTYALQEYHTHRGQLSELESGVEDAQFRLDDAAANLARRQNELATKRELFEGLSQKRQQLEYELVQARAGMDSARQRQQYAQQQLKQIAEQVEAFEADRQNVEAKLTEVSQSLEAESETLARLTAELEEQRAKIEQRQQAFRDGQLRFASINKTIEQHKAAILDLMRKLAQVNSRLGHIEIERKNIASQQSRLAERRKVVVGELETLETSRAQSQQELDGTLAEIQDQQQQLEAKREEATHLGKQLAQVTEQLGAAKEHRSGLLSRQKLLKDLEAKREGVSVGVKSVLRQREERFPFIRGLVADVLQVDVEHAHVIEAALDGRDQWLVTNELATLAANRDKLEDLEGRVNVLSTDRLLRDTGFQPVQAALEVEDPQHGRDARATGYDWNQHPHRIRLGIDLVRFDPADAQLAWHLLGRTVIVDDLSVARDLHEHGPGGWRYVTKLGEVLEADGTLRAGPLTAAMGLLSRRSELEAIAQQIADVDERITQLTASLSQGNTAAKGLEEQQNALRNEVYRLNTIKVELSSKIARNNDQQNALRREQPVLDRELESLLSQIGKLKTEEQTLAEQRQQMEADQTARQQQVTELTAGTEALAEEIRQTSEELTAARVQLGQVQEKQLASQQQVQRQTAAKAELAQQSERLLKSAQTIAQRRESVEAELKAAQHAEETLVETQKGLASQIESVAAQVTESGEAVRTLSGQVESLRGEHAQIEHELHNLQLRLGEVKVRLETLVSRTMEELQLDLPGKYDSLSADGGPGYQPADLDWDALAEEIKQLRDKIHRLGNVNLDAIGEQDELETRSQFLTTQVTDLTASKKQLEELIDEINRESSVRFEQTFNAVREHFQGMFRKLFGGGKADIYLETELQTKKPELGPDGQPLFETKRIDVLDAGIEVIARPPGKQPVSISQLSGGEKTMTCVALLMSIFKSKPSPFCILDEVDAALDEANNQRFNLIVQEFLDQSQFIVITHSKRTMQIADVLYGVTMQEQGVSKRVAVKFDQVDAQGRINEQAAA